MDRSTVATPGGRLSEEMTSGSRSSVDTELVVRSGYLLAIVRRGFLAAFATALTRMPVARVLHRCLSGEHGERCLGSGVGAESWSGRESTDRGRVHDGAAHRIASGSSPACRFR